MSDILRGQWHRDAKNGDEVLMDLDTNKEVLRRVGGQILPPMPKLKLAIKIVETVEGHRLDIKYPQKAHYENPERYVEALSIAARAIMAEMQREQARLTGDSMEAL